MSLRWCELAIDLDAPSLLDIRQPPWFLDVLCREPSAVASVGMHFVDAENNHKASAAAMQVCGHCLVMAECRAVALADASLLGIWDGTGSSARRVMRRPR